MPSVIIVDDEALIRSGFELILSSTEDINVVATSDGMNAVELITQHQPDVVLLDVRMPGKDGLTVLGELSEAGCSPVVAILTTFGFDDYVAAALRLGAAGFLLKDTDPVQLPNIIRTLAAGGMVLSDRVAPQVVAGFLDDRTDHAALNRTRDLSNRELDVLQLLARGHSNGEIAATLYSSIGTVKDQVSSILSKLSVKTRVEAAIIAQRAGLLDGES